MIVSNTCRLDITFIGKNAKEIFTGFGKLETKPAELVADDPKANALQHSPLRAP